MIEPRDATDERILPAPPAGSAPASARVEPPPPPRRTLLLPGDRLGELRDEREGPRLERPD